MLAQRLARVVVLAIVSLQARVSVPTAAAQAPRGPTRVLVLFQQQAESQPMVEFTQRLRLTIREELAAPVEFYQESLDLDRFRGARSASFSEYFEKKYRGFGIDVVIPVGGRALRFAIDQLHDVLPNVPIVFALNAAPQLDASTLPRNVTGRFARATRFTPTLEMALALQPDAERVVIIGGVGPADSAAVSAALGAVTAHRTTLPVSVLQGLSLNVLLGQLRQLSPRTIVIFANYRQDLYGQVFEPLDVVGSMARASAAPMYTQLLSYVGEGLVGGSVTRFDNEGERTARLVARALRRDVEEPMPPVEVIDNLFLADWRQLRRWHLSEQRLPPGTEILFREQTRWERYRTLVILSASIVVAQTVLILWLLFEHRKRKRAQSEIEQQAQTIRQNEVLNRSVLASISAPIAILDRRGTIIRVNDAWREAARRAEGAAANDAFMGWSYLEECRRAEKRGCAEASDVRRGIESVLEERAWPFRFEYHHLEPRSRWYELFVDRLEYAEGGAIVTHVDITDRRIAERQAEETRWQMAHMGRVALIGELSATISHELRQPLTAIRANAQAGALLLTATPPDIAEVRDILQSIVTDDARAVSVIEGVRKLLRKENAMSETVDMNDICRDASRLLHHDATLRSTRLELALSTSPTTVLGDPVQLEQMVLNLSLNGLEAAVASSRERCVVLSTLSRVTEVEVAVRDSGPGIAPDVQPRLFEAFFSTKREGLGLGLTIVRSIVERHNGRVLARNDPTGGAEFRVILPAVPGVTADGNLRLTQDRREILVEGQKRDALA